MLARRRRGRLEIVFARARPLLIIVAGLLVVALLVPMARWGYRLPHRYGVADHVLGELERCPAAIEALGSPARRAYWVGEGRLSWSSSGSKYSRFAIPMVGSARRGTLEWEARSEGEGEPWVYEYASLTVGFREYSVIPCESATAAQP